MRFYFLILCCAAFSAAGQVTNRVPQAALATNLGPVASLLAADGNYIADEKHVLEPGDRVSFRIVEDRDPAVGLVVADSHELDVPYVGRVSTVNKTCKQLQADLKVLLEKEYYYRATVILGVDLVNKVRGKVYVWGQVRNQGAIELPFNETLTAGKAILRAGGFGDFARKDKVKIIRSSPQPGGEKRNFEVNMVNVLENGKVDQDIVLEPDDYIVVPQRGINF